MMEEKKETDFGLGGLGKAVAELRAEGRVRAEAIDKRFEAIDKRFERIGKRFDRVESRLSATDGHLLALHRLLIRVSVGGAVAISLSLIGIIAQLTITLA